MDTTTKNILEESIIAKNTIINNVVEDIIVDINKSEEIQIKESVQKIKKEKSVSTQVKKKVVRKENYYEIDISDIPSYVNTVNKFMSLHPELFKTNVNKKIIYIHDNQIYNVYADPVKFNDIIHNIKGYITTEYNSDKFIMVLHIRSPIKEKPGAPQCYIKQLETYVNTQLISGNTVQLYYYKILNDTIIKHCYYDQPTHQWEMDVKILQDEFFSPNKDALLAIMNNKNSNNTIGNITSSYNNLILYGSYGTGKSTYIFRDAVASKSSILSVDLSLFLNEKKDIYALFHGQEFCLPNSTEKQPAMHNCIIVLEEFDDSVRKLLDIENILQYKDILKRNYLDLKNKELKERAKEFVKSSEFITNDSTKINKIETSIDPEITSDDFMTQMLLEDGLDIKNNQISESMQREMLESRDYGNEMNIINTELNTMIKNMDTDNRSNIVRASDVRELFQGPVPVKGRRIMATTNDFEMIKKLLPALVRAGRLTSIPFDNFDWATLNTCTNHYFKKQMTLSEFKITIPSSEIIELAIKYVLTKAPFEKFEQELQSLCSLHN